MVNFIVYSARQLIKECVTSMTLGCNAVQLWQINSDLSEAFEQFDVTEEPCDVTLLGNTDSFR